MNSIIEEQFMHSDHLCVVLFTPMGHRCGYVAVTEDSPLYEVDYTSDLKKPELLKELEQSEIGKRGIIPLFCWDGKKTTPEILFNVHGGITFSGSSKEDYPIKSEKPLWWFGFDCAHCDDAPDIMTADKYYNGNHNASSMFMRSGVIRTKDYVIQECKNLAEQISCVESTY